MCPLGTYLVPLEGCRRPAPLDISPFVGVSRVFIAGVTLATVTQRLGLEALIDATVRLVGGVRPGRKVSTLVNAIIAGASPIDHVDILHAGSTERVLGHRVMALSTIGTFLRSFTFGHVRQLEAVVGKLIERAWGLGAGPGDAPLVIDTSCEISPAHIGISPEHSAS